MNIELVGTGAEATLFTDVDTSSDYVVVPYEWYGWEHLYTITDIADDETVQGVDGATAEEALRNYLELGRASVAELDSWEEYRDHERFVINTISRLGADKEYKVMGSQDVYTVSWAGKAFRWRVFKNNSDEYVVVKARSGQHAVVEYILDKEEVEHNV